jgi:hypothetical protein
MACITEIFRTNLKGRQNLSTRTVGLRTEFRTRNLSNTRKLRRGCIHYRCAIYDALKTIASLQTQSHCELHGVPLNISLVRKTGDTIPHTHNWTRDAVLQSHGHYSARKGSASSASSRPKSNISSDIFPVETTFGSFGSLFLNRTHLILSLPQASDTIYCHIHRHTQLCKKVKVKLTL